MLRCRHYLLLTAWVAGLLLTFSVTTHAQDLSAGQADSLHQMLSKNVQGINRLNILLTLAEFQILKPGERPLDFDSANVYLKEATRLNQSLRSPAHSGHQLLIEGYLTKEKGEKEQARKMVEQAIVMLEKTDSIFYLGKAYYELSSYYGYKEQEDLDERIKLVEKAIAAYDSSGAISEKAFSLKMLGDLQTINRNFPAARDALLSSLAAYESIRYPKLQGVYDMLGRLYKYYDDYKKALQYESLALKAAETNGDTTLQIGIINNTVGAIYKELGRKDIAIEHYRKALRTVIQLEDTFGVALIVFNISVCFDAFADPSKTFEFLESLPKRYLHPAGPLEKGWIAMAFINAYQLVPSRYHEATRYCEQLINLHDNPEIPSEYRNKIYWLIASHFIRTKQFDKARLYLNRNITLSRQLPGSTKRMADDSRLWYMLDSAQGNYKSAFNHLNRYKSLSDTLMNETKVRQMQQLEVEYETAKKEDSLKLKNQNILLLTERNNVQHAILQRSDLIKTLQSVASFCSQ